MSRPLRATRWQNRLPARSGGRTSAQRVNASCAPRPTWRLWDARAISFSSVSGQRKQQCSVALRSWPIGLAQLSSFWDKGEKSIMSVDKSMFRRRQRQLETTDYHTGEPSPTPWQSDEVIDRYVPTHCCYCGVQCGMYLKVAQNRVVGVEPRADFPLNHGMLCPKGATAYQTVNNPDRLLYPLMRRHGKNSPLERASWDEVLDTIATRFRTLQSEYGKNAVAVYSGSSMTNAKCYLMG